MKSSAFEPGLRSRTLGSKRFRFVEFSCFCIILWELLHCHVCGRYSFSALDSLSLLWKKKYILGVPI